MAGKPFVSSFVTGPRLRGDGDKNQISEYVTLMAKSTANASALVRGRIDWTNTINSKKWSSEQQWYTIVRNDRTLSRKRILIRGIGPAIQLSVRSEDGKAFNLVGWTAWDSVDGVA